MKLHANAALSLNQRRRLVRRVVEQEWTLTKAAAAAEVSVRCARKWVGRYRGEGELGLLDRSSAPVIVANRTDERRIEAIAALRGSVRCSVWGRGDRCGPVGAEEGTSCPGRKSMLMGISRLAPRLKRELVR